MDQWPRRAHNPPLKEATAKRYHYPPTNSTGICRLFYWPTTTPNASRPCTGLTPHAFVCAQWQKNPTVFTHNPTHLTLVLYSYARPAPFPILTVRFSDLSAAKTSARLR